ncbi:cytochrome d ubiquinol oxidase subunit II [Alkalihalobacillus sp. LMS39]|uniref:cytochrome d ubiquinol oxidase subunit II n=1 Tax=Alkalihalobacillus sp. LMS39 TaxID=2924032 RepID=UPI001FB4C6BA|nr:cytochrome d ubiquinol oxidase subunit II [Alkalihalobacillus sp. LMS39]UOE92590.1 cytochrome d ubiquinol oxidase subunit II [Alkalihalobacillus sp. LMS39]
MLWVFLFLYFIFTSIDCGAGFYHFISRLRNEEKWTAPVLSRYVSPVWEVTNVFLVFFFVGLVTFFPETAYYYGTLLLLPVSVSLLLIIIRGAYYAIDHYGNKENRFYLFLYSMTGLFIPASFVVIFPLSEGLFYTEENNQWSLHYTQLMTNPYTWSVIVLSLVSVLYISACFFTFYSHRAGQRPLTEQMKKRTFYTAGLVLLFSSVCLYFMNEHSPVFFERVMAYSLIFSLAFIAALWTIYHLLFQQYGRACCFMLIQYAFIFLGYGKAHFPYLLYPHVTAYNGFTTSVMSQVLWISLAIGLIILFPSLFLLFRFFIYDKEYVKGKR